MLKSEFRFLINSKTKTALYGIKRNVKRKFGF